MKKIALLAILFIIPNLMAAIEPSPFYCERQGYAIDYNTESGEEFCIFNDNKSCKMWSFYSGECGQEYVKEFPCVKQGQYVFSEFEKCCDGLQPYLPSGMVGQQTCEPIPGFIPKNDNKPESCIPLFVFLSMFMFFVSQHKIPE